MMRPPRARQEPEQAGPLVEDPVGGKEREGGEEAGQRDALEGSERHGRPADDATDGTPHAEGSTGRRSASSIDTA